MFWNIRDSNNLPSSYYDSEKKEFHKRNLGIDLSSRNLEISFEIKYGWVHRLKHGTVRNRNEATQ